MGSNNYVMMSSICTFGNLKISKQEWNFFLSFLFGFCLQEAKKKETQIIKRKFCLGSKIHVSNSMPSCLQDRDPLNDDLPIDDSIISVGGIHTSIDSSRQVRGPVHFHKDFCVNTFFFYVGFQNRFFCCILFFIYIYLYIYQPAFFCY